MTPAQLIEKLQALPQDMSILCQVCGAEGGAWNMHYEFHDVPDTSFIQLRVSHPEMKTLPKLPEEQQ